MSLPHPLLDFIRRYVHSLETLEILLLLERAPDTFWRATAIDSHFGMKEGTAEKSLQDLLQNGFVTRGTVGGYRYAPESDDLRAGIATLAAAYADQRSTVVYAVYSENMEHLRAFADAFKVKSE